MTRTEWVNRCAKRLMALTGDQWNYCLRDAGTLADTQFEEHGASALAWEVPEGVAEAEAIRLEDEREDKVDRTGNQT